MTAQERIELLIYPKEAETDAQSTALATAITLQEAFEAARGGAFVDPGVASVSNDGVSVTYRDGSGGFMASISPDALEVLRRYGLLPQGFPPGNASMTADEILAAALTSFETRTQALGAAYLKAMGEHLRDIGQLLPSDVHRLAQLKKMGANMDWINREIAKALRASESDVEAMFTAIAKADYDFAKRFYVAGQVLFAENKILNRILQAQIDQTMGALKNLSQTTVVKTSYQSAIDKAVQAVQTGVTDYSSAIRGTVREAARSGLRVRYESGLTRRLDSAVRQNVIDGARQINQNIALQTGKEFGADGVEISAHNLCAEDHVPYQGKQYSMKGFEALQASLYRPISQWNCRHIANPIILGISQPTYSADQLKKFRDDSMEIVEIDGVKDTRYGWTQAQRRIETEIRYQKDARVLAESSGDAQLKRETTAEIKALQKTYEKVSKEAGLISQYNRTVVPYARKGKAG